jgi:hypothetical protein
VTRSPVTGGKVVGTLLAVVELTGEELVRDTVVETDVGDRLGEVDRVVATGLEPGGVLVEVARLVLEEVEEELAVVVVDFTEVDVVEVGVLLVVGVEDLEDELVVGEIDPAVDRILEQEGISIGTVNVVYPKERNTVLVDVVHWLVVITAPCATAAKSNDSRI